VKTHTRVQAIQRSCRAHNVHVMHARARVTHTCVHIMHNRVCMSPIFVCMSCIVPPGSYLQSIGLSTCRAQRQHSIQGNCICNHTREGKGTQPTPGHDAQDTHTHTGLGPRITICHDQLPSPFFCTRMLKRKHARDPWKHLHPCLLTHRHAHTQICARSH